MKRKIAMLVSLAVGLGFGLGSVGDAAPLAPGSVADDVGFSEGSAFSGNYRRFTQRTLDDYPDKVIVLVYFTPW